MSIFKYAEVSLLLDIFFVWYFSFFWIELSLAVTLKTKKVSPPLQEVNSKIAWGSTFLILKKFRAQEGWQFDNHSCSTKYVRVCATDSIKTQLKILMNLKTGNKKDKIVLLSLSNIHNKLAIYYTREVTIINS